MLKRWIWWVLGGAGIAAAAVGSAYSDRAAALGVHVALMLAWALWFWVTCVALPIGVIVWLFRRRPAPRPPRD